MDSIWAHRASGLRGSLLRMVEDCETGVSLEKPANLDESIKMGYLLMEKAARV